MNYALMAAAEKYAGAHVHEVSHHLTVYQLGCELLFGPKPLAEKRRDAIVQSVAEAELWLRQFVAKQRLSMLCPPDTPPR